MIDDPTAVTETGNDATKLGEASEAATLVPATGAGGTTVELPPPGYALGEQIGRGGMGEVIVAHDLRIGRDVAIKRMTAAAPDQEQIGRFLREARIQARLEHPAIVPVHELGVDDKGRPFFTMKRLAGQTLGQRQNEGWSANRLLRAYVEVCLAIEFAHARGVVHRDLKPSNIMLGDFGEVYVIDWGIARVLTDDAEVASKHPDIGTLDEGTKTGTLLGTPGYMSPEQIRGQRATEATDVYALGAILFELLADEPLHPRGEKGISATLAHPQALPSDRRPERQIPPELDAACFAALAEDPDARPTAHDLAERVRAYLDGDRDLERRRELSADQLAEAHAVLDAGGPDARAAAMRRAGRALALDPQSEEAAQLVSSLLLQPPAILPPDLERGLDAHERDLNKDRANKAIAAYLALFAVLPLSLVMEIKNWSLVIGLYATIVVALLATVRSARTGRPSPAVILFVNLAIALLFSRLASPFIIVPLLVCSTVLAISTIPWFSERPLVVPIWTGATVMLPIVLEWTGVLPRTWTIIGERMVIISDIVRTRGLGDELSLVFGNLVLMIAFAVFAVAIARTRRTAQQHLYIQAWHLRQLLPSSKQAWPRNR